MLYRLVTDVSLTSSQDSFVRVNADGMCTVMPDQEQETPVCIWKK